MTNYAVINPQIFQARQRNSANDKQRSLMQLLSMISVDSLVTQSYLDGTITADEFLTLDDVLNPNGDLDKWEIESIQQDL